VEPEPAFGWPTRHVVLDAVALEDLDGAIVSLDREMDRQLSLRDTQHGSEARLERDVVGGSVELGERRGQRT
jgi:hypothetical protein